MNDQSTTCQELRAWWTFADPSRVKCTVSVDCDECGGTYPGWISRCRLCRIVKRSHTFGSIKRSNRCCWVGLLSSNTDVSEWEFVSDHEAERRVLQLVNPALSWNSWDVKLMEEAPYTTDTIYAGLQLIQPVRQQVHIVMWLSHYDSSLKVNEGSPLLKARKLVWIGKPGLIIEEMF